MGKYENAKAVLKKYKHVPVRPPAGNTYFCYAPDLCPACHAQREEERERRRKIMNALEHSPYDKYGQGYSRARNEYLNSILPEWQGGPAPKDCVNKKKQRALYDEWNERVIALEKASIAMGRDKHYLSRLEIHNMQAAENGGEQIAVGDRIPYWDYDPEEERADRLRRASAAARPARPASTCTSWNPNGPRTPSWYAARAHLPPGFYSIFS